MQFFFLLAGGSFSETFQCNLANHLAKQLLKNGKPLFTNVNIIKIFTYKASASLCLSLYPGCTFPIFLRLISLRKFLYDLQFLWTP